MKNRKLIIAGLIALLVIVFGLNIYISLPKAIKEIDQKTITITVVDNTKNVDKTYTIKTSKDTLLDALKPLGIISGVESGNNYTVTSVNGLEADNNGQTWELSINGNVSKTPINNIEIKNNDRVEFDLVSN